MRGILSLALALSLTGLSSALEPITVKGNAFFAGDERWYIRGVDYQPGGSSKLQDPLAHPEICKRDIKYFEELGINAIRVYTIDNSKNHDECMKALEDKGIYLILDVNDPNRSIHRDDPAPSYNEVYLQHVFATIDVFGKYKNTAMLFSANEVVNKPENTASAKYVKAVTRDMKNYIEKHLDRKIPVGYSAADVVENRMEMMQYLNCGDDVKERADFFAFNDYSWCGDSSFHESGWDKKVEDYKELGLPLFLSEYGCNTFTDRAKTGRIFTEVKSLYSTEMTGVFSGGLVYEYSMEDSDFGLVKISKDKKTITTLKDFDNLKDQFASVKNPSGDGDYEANVKTSKCPAVKKGVWEADTKIPTLPKKAQVYMEDGAGKPLGSPTVDLPTSGDDSSEDDSSSDSSTDDSSSDSSTDDSSKDDDEKNSGSISHVTQSFVWAMLIVGSVVVAI